MQRAGVYNLGATEITAPVTDRVITSAAARDGCHKPYISDLAGLSALGIVVDFVSAGGSGTVAVAIQTTFDGEAWLDVARFDLLTTRRAWANISAAPAKAPDTYAALVEEGCHHGLLGATFRAVVTSTGAFAAGSRLRVDAVAR